MVEEIRDDEEEDDDLIRTKECLHCQPVKSLVN